MPPPGGYLVRQNVFMFSVSYLIASEELKRRETPQFFQAIRQMTARSI
ncbi:MAG: hypothetical protein LZF60_170090 [Nitrospira sp.]|nr:MAG: hypothetical protein LZF60_170090 [Nitrospira sp.]